VVSDDICVADVEEWAEGLEEIGDLIGPRFVRSEPRRNAVGYVRGLLSDEERKNSWTLSERAGHGTPDGCNACSRPPTGTRMLGNDLFIYVNRHLGDPGGILIIDETGFLKKGGASAGVARQYSGTAGRVENYQIGVFLTYSAPAGRTLLDRELYLPKTWADDRERCDRTGIPDPPKPENTGYWPAVP
jgi:SRSO17 transposase